MVKAVLNVKCTCKELDKLEELIQVEEDEASLSDKNEENKKYE